MFCDNLQCPFQYSLFFRRELDAILNTEAANVTSTKHSPVQHKKKETATEEENEHEEGQKEQEKDRDEQKEEDEEDVRIEMHNGLRGNTKA